MNIDDTIPAQILEIIQNDKTEAESHLSAQYYADQLQVSRSPINKALSILENHGVVKREQNKGYFLVRNITEPVEELCEKFNLNEQDTNTSAYFQIADDRLRGLLPDKFTESQIKQLYNLTSGQLQAVLTRIADEGWAYKSQGYGWVFSPMLTTPESLIQSYRLRLAVEPAALLEPNYRLEQNVLDRCRKTELYFLEGGIETSTVEQIHRRGVQFHVAIIEASGNPFFIDTIKRVHKIRLLLSYRSMQDRRRYREHGKQHLQILELLGQKRNKEASIMLREHLKLTIKYISEISNILKS